MVQQLLNIEEFLSNKNFNKLKTKNKNFREISGWALDIVGSCWRVGFSRNDFVIFRQEWSDGDIEFWVIFLTRKLI